MPSTTTPTTATLRRHGNSTQQQRTSLMTSTTHHCSLWITSTLQQRTISNNMSNIFSWTMRLLTMQLKVIQKMYWRKWIMWMDRKKYKKHRWISKKTSYVKIMVRYLYWIRCDLIMMPRKNVLFTQNNNQRKCYAFGQCKCTHLYTIQD